MAKSDSGSSNQINMKYVGLAVVLVLIVIVGIFVFQNNKSGNGYNGAANNSSTNNSTGNYKNSTANDGSASLSLDPNSQTVGMGKNLTITIYEDSGSDSVNAVQANLTYPTDLFEFVKIDASDSAFAIKAQSDGGKGIVKIARGTINPVTAKQLVAKVVLKAKTSSGEAHIDFANGSGVVRSSDNKEILQNQNGGTYTLSQ